MNEEDADESSAHELHHGENNPHRVRKFRKRVKKVEGKKGIYDQGDQLSSLLLYMYLLVSYID
jgi:hypothetical protein